MIIVYEIGDLLPSFEASPFLISAVWQDAVCRCEGVTGMRVQRHGEDILLMGSASGDREPGAAARRVD